MSQHRFAALMLASTGALALNNSSEAQDAFTASDGCAVLAQLIYEEVTADAWNGSVGGGQLARRPRETRIAICNDTTRTVTAAYSAAMTSIGSEVRWRIVPGEPGDPCLGGFLHLCYPDRFPPGGKTEWQAVSDAVQQAMPNGAASDQSVFSSAAMRLAIRSALATDGLRR